MTLANAHALFCGLKADPSYLANLTVPDRERFELLAARKLVRTTLRAAAKKIAVQEDYWQDVYRSRVSSRNRPVVEIKFMTQGSFAYQTLNSPARIPAQEIDLDDGMYVPVEFLENGEPALAAKGLFAFADAALLPLCDQKGWELDTSKECCIRVRVWKGAHIDLPIYSIPRDRFETITETLAKSDTFYFAHDSVSGPRKIPSDLIMLAHRSGRWAHSDPQLLHDWVEARVDRYGPVYRRLCRFFKGWRDFTWDRSKLSSITIMRAIDLALSEMPGLPTENRDDELILEIARRLPSILGGKITNPVIENLVLNNWSSEVRDEIVGKATTLKDEMEAALERTGVAHLVVKRLQNGFGLRIPNRPDAIKIASTIAAIQSAPAATVAAPRVIRSTSG